MENLPTGAVFAIENDNHRLLLQPLQDIGICVNGKNANGITDIASGDCITIGAYDIHFYKKAQRPSPSPICRILAATAGVLIFVFFILDLLAIAFLPVYVRKSSSWTSYRDRQEISNLIENSRRELKNACGTDSISKSLLENVNAELNNMAFFFKNNYNLLSPAQRKELRQEIQILKTAATNAMQANLKEQASPLDLDDIIQRIIQQQ